MEGREAHPGLNRRAGAAPAAVLFDRDGVLNRLVARGVGGPGEAPLRPAQVALAAGVGPALVRLRSAGFLLAVVTNQPAVAKGQAEPADVEAVQAEVMGRLAGQGVTVDTVRMCLHHPEGRPGHPLSVACACRKPAPGMLLSALAELGADPRSSWMVGDSDSDVAAGLSAGLSTVLVDSEGGGHKRSGRPAPDARVADVAAAAEVIASGRWVAVRPGEPPTSI